MLKGAKRKHSRAKRKCKRIAVSPSSGVMSAMSPVAGTGGGVACLLWTSAEGESSSSPKQHKITGFFPHLDNSFVYLDHNYVFSPSSHQLTPPQNGSLTYANIQVKGMTFCISPTKAPSPAPLKRPALKPAKKCQKSKEAANHKNPTIPDFFPVRRSLRKTLVKMKKEKLKDIEDAILSGSEDGYEVKDFNGKGRGVMNLKPLKQGDFVLEYYGDLLTRDEAKMREFVYSQNENVGCYMYYFTYNNKAYCIDATRESGRLGRLVNHCKKGNLSTKVIVVGGQPHLILVAKQDISAGQELLYDYGDRSKRSIEFHPWLAS